MFDRWIVKPQEQLEQLSRLFHAANRQFGGGLGGLGGLLGGELLLLNYDLYITLKGMEAWLIDWVTHVLICFCLAVFCCCQRLLPSCSKRFDRWEWWDRWQPGGWGNQCLGGAGYLQGSSFHFWSFFPNGYLVIMVILAIMVNLGPRLHFGHHGKSWSLLISGYHGFVGHHVYLGQHGYLIEQAIQQWMANGGVENLIMQVLKSLKYLCIFLKPIFMRVL